MEGRRRHLHGGREEGCLTRPQSTFQLMHMRSRSSAKPSSAANKGGIRINSVQLHLRPTFDACRGTTSTCIICKRSSHPTTLHDVITYDTPRARRIALAVAIASQYFYNVFTNLYLSTCADPRFWAKPEAELASVLRALYLPRVFRSQNVPVACLTGLSFFYGILARGCWRRRPPPSL